MNGHEEAIAIPGRREDWPGGLRTLTARTPMLEPNGTPDPAPAEVSGGMGTRDAPRPPSAGCSPTCARSR